MFWVTIAGRIMLLLPLAEVPQGEGGIFCDIWSMFFNFYHHKFYHRECNRVVNSWVAVNAGSYSH